MVDFRSYYSLNLIVLSQINLVYWCVLVECQINQAGIEVFAPEKNILRQVEVVEPHGTHVLLFNPESAVNLCSLLPFNSIQNVLDDHLRLLNGLFIKQFSQMIHYGVVSHTDNGTLTHNEL